MASNNGCDIYPLVNGEPSKLYQDLLSLLNNNRPLANLIYAAYLQQGVAAQMDNEYSRNNQNEHNAEDVYKALNVHNIVKNQGGSMVTALEHAGAVDKHGNRIIYNDGKQALEKAKAFNDSSLGESFVASVWQHEDQFQIYVEEKNSRTVQEAGAVEQQLQAWNLLSQVFNMAGLDINALKDISPDLFSPTRIKQLLQQLDSLSRMSPSNLSLLSQRDLHMILQLNSNNPTVQRIEQRFGTLKDAADVLYNFLHGNMSGITQTDATRFNTIIPRLTSIGGINIQALTTQINDLYDNLASTDKNLLIAETIESFGKEVNPNIIDDLGNTTKKIISLRDAAVKALQILSRKLEEAYNQKDERAIVELKRKKSFLLNQIDGKCYYAGTLQLMQDVLSDAQALMQTIQNPPAGTRLEQIITTSNNYKQLSDLINEYQEILEALSNLDKIIINENISRADEQNLQSTAESSLSLINDIKRIMDKGKVDLAVDILVEYLGEESINGVPIAILATQAANDTNFFDMLFSGTDVSSPLVSAVSAIIRRAQQERDKELVGYSDRIQQATNRAIAAGIKSFDWVYEPDGTIVSDINWFEYFRARTNYRESLIQQGFFGYDLDSRMLDWEENNTEDRVVDTVNNRTERVPNGNYRKAMPAWYNGNTPQRVYYDTMMQIKGELGTALPEYARDHYTPPQIRFKFFDAMKDAVKNYKGKDRITRIRKIIGSRFSEMFVWREDEEFVDKNGYYNGGFSSVSAEPDGTRKKRIPIFYRGTLRDSSWLDKNFSRALGLMASTAVNYKAMSKIENAVKYMQGFVEDLGVAAEDAKGNRLVNLVENSRVKVVQRIHKLISESNLRSVLAGIVDTQMYQESGFKKNAWTKFVTSLIKYTSVTSLTVNVKGAFVNDAIGVVQTIIEAAGGEFFTFKDWAIANTQLLNPTTYGRRMSDIINGTKLSIETLLDERFNVQQKVFDNIKEKSYYTSLWRRSMDSVEPLVLYGLGEFHIHQINLRAILNNEKVLLNGKKVPLRKVFDKTTPVDGVSKLIIKQGATRLDGSPITEEYLDSIKNIVKLVNQEHHGAMSNEDKGTIHRYLWGKAIINLKQWMVKHYSRRFKSAHKDPLTRKEREGFYKTTTLMMLASLLECKRLKFLSTRLIGTQWVRGLIGNKKWENLEKDVEAFKGLYLYKNIKGRDDKMRLANIRKAFTEHVLALILAGLKWIPDDDDDDEKTWAEYHYNSVINRMYTEVLSSTPIMLVPEGLKLVKNPVPASNKLTDLIYPITGIINGDIAKEYERGPFEGESVYIHKIKYNTIPFGKQIDYFINPEHDTWSGGN